ncbi:hypothetical protein JCM10450v2_003867 [Rhodotorula kratochvilovae]
MATSLSRHFASPFPSRVSTPVDRAQVSEPPPHAVDVLVHQHKIPPAVHTLSVPVPDEHGGHATGFLHLCSDSDTTSGRPHSRTAAILLSGGVAGPASLYLALATKLPALEARIPVLRLDYRYPARTAPCAADVLATMEHLAAEYGVERFVLGGWSFGSAPALTVAGRDARVVGCALVAPQMADALHGARECGRRGTPLLLMHGTGDRTSSPRCREGIYEAWRSKAPPGTGDELAQLVLFDGDDHALTHHAREVEAMATMFILRLSNSPNLAALTETIALLRDNLDFWVREHYIFVGFQLVILSSLFLWYLQIAFPTPADLRTDMASLEPSAADKLVKTADLTVSAPAGDKKELDPPKDTPFSSAELAKYDGKDEATPIYVGIKGRIYDVSAKRDMYGPGCGYHVFVGKDASRALGKSSLKLEDAVADYSTLTEEESKVLDDWEKYFQKRYNIVGKVVD